MPRWRPSRSSLKRCAADQWGSTDFFSVGLLCIGFFTVATVARLLALRAKANERLAVERGEDLQRQQALNEQIIRDMPDGVVVLSAQGQVRLYNPRATALLGRGLPRASRFPPTFRARGSISPIRTSAAWSSEARPCSASRWEPSTTPAMC